MGYPTDSERKTDQGQILTKTQMRFEDRNDGEYRIHAGALELREGMGHLAAVIVVHFRKGATKGTDVFRDIAISGGYRWLTSDQALQQAFVSGNAAIAAERRRIERGMSSSAPSSLLVLESP